MAGVTEYLIMKARLLCVAFLSALLGPAPAVTIAYYGTALRNVQGSVPGDLGNSLLALVVLDIQGNGFSALNQEVTTWQAGLDVGSYFGDDVVVARQWTAVVVGDSTAQGSWALDTNLNPDLLGKRWAVVWFETLSRTTTGYAPEGAKFGIASGSNWVTPASAPPSGQSYTYGSTYLAQIVLANGGSVPILPPNATFATSGTSMMVVPEVEVAAMSALGLLGLVRRRRCA